MKGAAARRVTGLVIGKFLPPHAGHAYLLERARERVDALHVVLFTKAAEPIAGAVRERWMRRLFPFASVHRVSAEHGVDFGSEEAWRFWVARIRAVLPERADLVFSSEPYGEELARRLNARHVLVDPDRRAVPVSGSEVRADPRACWRFLSPPVRAYYARRERRRRRGTGRKAVKLRGPGAVARKRER